MSEKNLWMLRAGEAAYAIEDFRAKGVVAIGWPGKCNHDFMERDA